MTEREIREVFRILAENYRSWNAPVVTLIAQHSRDPFQVLVCALLSTRTRDETTARVCRRFLEKVRGPEDLLRIPVEELERLIYPVGFYRNKARQLKEIAKDLKERFRGKVPDNLEDLLSLKGVGRKVANLVLADGYRKPAICVDTHVHRITNRWGLVKTRTPEETERELMKKVPRDLWIPVNRLLVALGQKICTPRNPKCDVCPVERFCGKVGL
ncbi:MAG: endonuclease III [Aquificota bacterium]|nr:endonuclease III [Aquificota bacterium]